MQKHITITLSGNLAHKGLKLRAMMLANEFDIKGSVAENEKQVVIEAEGTNINLDLFARAISKYGKDDPTKDVVQISGNKPLSYFEEFIIK